MNKINFNTSFTIFILFFGVVLIEAIEKHNWLESLLILALGVVSFFGSQRTSYRIQAKRSFSGSAGIFL